MEEPGTTDTSQQQHQQEGSSPPIHPLSRFFLKFGYRWWAIAAAIGAITCSLLYREYSWSAANHRLKTTVESLQRDIDSLVLRLQLEQLTPSRATCERLINNDDENDSGIRDRNAEFSSYLQQLLSSTTNGGGTSSSSTSLTNKKEALLRAARVMPAVFNWNGLGTIAVCVAMILGEIYRTHRATVFSSDKQQQQEEEESSSHWALSNRYFEVYVARYKYVSNLLVHSAVSLLCGLAWCGIFTWSTFVPLVSKFSLLWAVSGFVAYWIHNLVRVWRYLPRDVHDLQRSVRSGSWWYWLISRVLTCESFMYANPTTALDGTLPALFSQLFSIAKELLLLWPYRYFYHYGHFCQPNEVSSSSSYFTWLGSYFSWLGSFFAVGSGLGFTATSTSASSSSSGSSACPSGDGNYSEPCSLQDLSDIAASLAPMSQTPNALSPSRVKDLFLLNMLLQRSLGLALVALCALLLLGSPKRPSVWLRKALGVSQRLSDAAPVAMVLLIANGAIALLRVLWFVFLSRSPTWYGTLLTLLVVAQYVCTFMDAVPFLAGMMEQTEVSQQQQPAFVAAFVVNHCKEFREASLTKKQKTKTEGDFEGGSESSSSNRSSGSSGSSGGAKYGGSGNQGDAEGKAVLGSDSGESSDETTRKAMEEIGGALGGLSSAETEEVCSLARAMFEALLDKTSRHFITGYGRDREKERDRTAREASQAPEESYYSKAFKATCVDAFTAATFVGSKEASVGSGVGEEEEVTDNQKTPQSEKGHGRQQQHRQPGSSSGGGDRSSGGVGCAGGSGSGSSSGSGRPEVSDGLGGEDDDDDEEEDDDTDSMPDLEYVGDDPTQGDISKKEQKNKNKKKGTDGGEDTVRAERGPGKGEIGSGEGSAGMGLGGDGGEGVGSGTGGGEGHGREEWLQSIESTKTVLERVLGAAL